MIAYLDNAGTIMFVENFPNFIPATMACAYQLEKENARKTRIAKKIRNFVSTENATTFVMFMKIVDPFLVFVSITIARNLLPVKTKMIVGGDSNALKAYAQKWA